VTEYVFDVHTSKVSKALKVVLFHLWRVNVKTTRGFINIPLEDFHIGKNRAINITNCTINVLYNVVDQRFISEPDPAF
jgi:hypothetical protein